MLYSPWTQGGAWSSYSPLALGFHEKANVKRQTWLPLHFLSISWFAAGAVGAVGSLEGFPSRCGKVVVRLFHSGGRFHSASEVIPGMS